VVKASRSPASGGPPWTAVAIVSRSGPDHTEFPQLGVDGGGNVVAVWATTMSGFVGLDSARWLGAPRAPVLTGAAADPGTLTASFLPPPTTEAPFAPTNYEYSLDGGTTWTARSPASTVSPLVISGLVDFTVYTLRVRAINVAGPGAASIATGAIPGAGSEAPSDLAATAIAGNTVTIVWTPPAVGLVPIGYLLEGGVLPGQVLASIFTASTAPTFTFVAPTGAFFIRVHAITMLSRINASNEIRIFVNVPAAPSAPASLLGLVNGAALALSWTNTFGGGAPTALALSVTGALSGTIPLPLGETFAFPAVPPGTYTLRVIATNASGASPPSNPVTLTFPATCTGVPGVPTRVIATKTGSTISVTWSPPESGAAVTGYWLFVSGSYVGAFPTTARALSGAVGPGSYTLAVSAVNPCGASAPSLPQDVTIP
jgi:titin